MSWFRKTEGKICPLVGGPCLQHGCEFYTHLIGQDPQTGAEKDEWGCVAHWVPIMLTEVSLKVRGNQAAVESFRNVVLERAERADRAVLKVLSQGFKVLARDLVRVLTASGSPPEKRAIDDGDPDAEVSGPLLESR